ncbi:MULTISPECIES: hypothetical protein [Solibacillus]|uniref:Uncharacterized protein n=1 Tax=Solibacillus merdavium TaxID=2762218 RepID=A0ABR8XN40_9BACL|nr:hypothetical protein [Solibacillus merdavium]MBD8033337.1 hypothetical protein [Solibacillus merdavium]
MSSKKKMNKTNIASLVFSALALILLLLNYFLFDSNKNTISVAELTDRENAILSSSADQSFVYDFNTDKEYKEVTIWIEKYESGNLIEDKIGELSTQVEGDGSIIFTTSKNSISKQPTFNMAVGGKEGVSSISAYDANSKDLDDMSSVWGSFRGDNTSIEDEVVLGSICYSNDGRMNSLSAEFYQDVNGHINEIEKYDVVYLLKANFNKNIK